MTKIKNLSHFKRLAYRQGGLDCFIALAGGMMKSSKHIAFDGITYYVFNEIDGTEQKLKKDVELFTRSNIGEALKKGILYAE